MSLSDGDPDRVSTPLDKQGQAFPRELKRHKSGAPARPPAFFALRDAVDFEPPPGAHPSDVWGQYPRGFVAWAARIMGCQRNRILHLCSGALRPDDGLRVDIRREVLPDVVADARRLPLAEASVDAVMLDPPYSVEYARDLYGQEYARPSHLLAEAARVVKPCGPVGILHFIVPLVPRALGLRQVLVKGVTTGAGYRIRAFSVYRREQESLWV